MDAVFLTRRLLSYACSDVLNNSEDLVYYTYKDGSVHNAHFSEGAQNMISHCCGHTNTRCPKSYCDDDVVQVSCYDWNLSYGKVLTMAEEWLAVPRTEEDIDDMVDSWTDFYKKSDIRSLSDLQTKK